MRSESIRMLGFVLILIGAIGISLLNSKKKIENKIIFFILIILPLIGFWLLIG